MWLKQIIERSLQVKEVIDIDESIGDAIRAIKELKMR